MAEKLRTPTSPTSAPFRSNARTGTPSEEWILTSLFEKKRPSSLAKDQVRREAVWCTALKAMQEMTRRLHMKAVPAAGERVAFSQM